MLASEANVSPPRLKISKIAAGGDLNVPPVTRHPYFQIKLLCGCKPEITSAYLYDAIRESKGAEYGFTTADDLLQMLGGILGQNKMYNFYFVKLMLTNQSAGIPSGRPRFGAPAGSVGYVPYGQLGRS